MKKGDVFLQSYKVTAEIYNGFITLFKDKNPLHTNEAIAIQKSFSGVVMHGNILNGFISHFIGECLPTKDVVLHKQDIKYLNPVYMNDKLAFSAEVSDVFESVNCVEFKYVFIKEDDGKKVAKGKFQIGLI